MIRKKHRSVGANPVESLVRTLLARGYISCALSAFHQKFLSCLKSEALFKCFCGLWTLILSLSGKFEGVHSVVCLDGNFEQKRCAHCGLNDQPIHEPQSYFIHEREVNDMREKVERKRGKLPASATAEDTILPGLKMANHVYDSCTSRFIAADESNAKAEASVFSDTGLMALVCRHDRVLFMVNLHDAGEKQYNALALVNRLFLELPPAWRVGVLYDIGCQLHNSIVKVCFYSPNLWGQADSCYFSSTTSCQTFYLESILGWDVFMHSAMNLLARLSIILKNVLGLGIPMGKAVSDAGAIYRKRFQHFELPE